MPKFRLYRKSQLTEMRPYEEGELLNDVCVSDMDRMGGSPRVGDMIARNPKNHADQWLIAQDYFEANYQEV